METKSQTQNDRNTGSTIRRRVEKILREYWYLVVLLFAALVVNENIVQWVLAVQIGGHTVGTGFEDAFEYFTIFGYLFLTAFRLVPYAGLGIAVVILSKTKLKNYVLPVFIGGLIGILVIIIRGSWMALRPFYTEEHVSSTTAVSFIIIPIYAVPAGVLGAVFLAAIYTPLRFITKRKEAEQIDDPNA